MAPIALNRDYLWRIFWWTVFATAFGFTEATVVVYLRKLLDMPPGYDYPGVWHLHHLSFSSANFSSFFSDKGLLGLETEREVATIVLLAGAACAAGKCLWERAGLFLYTFAVWDLTYYFFLAPHGFFPKGLSSTDVYFLVPITWYGPLWLPVLVVMPVLIGCSLLMLRRSLRSHREDTEPRPTESPGTSARIVAADRVLR